ncbi:neuronal calcium sensor 2 isoform X1 [Cephus cinctus]|uniref:Neuronal calcium sensor 2 isoform X1 n=4 Tax=Neoptera TaxID=33340 RepID=A0AAJ7FPY0_CEPCN|nr:neuronal calcium sensor 2 isoform X1 [Cephus cinctus]
MAVAYHGTSVIQDRSASPTCAVSNAGENAKVKVLTDRTANDSPFCPGWSVGPKDSRKMGCFGSKDKLSKEDMDFLKSHTRYDEATIKEWYKGFKQDCPNGRLTPTKFVDMYKMFFPSGNAEEFCDHVFRTFDMDKNGYIDFKEFLLAIDVTSSGTPEEKLKWAFRMYDVDGNGVIDIQEMTKIVQAIYDMLGACSSNRPADSAEDRAKNIFAKMDENNDGQLTQDEFLKGCLQDEELSKMLAP